MPLLDFYRTNSSTVLQMTVHQIMANAGDGRLRDNSDCCNELREFLTLINSEKLGDYIYQSLDQKPERYENALQDLVNELGRRLDFLVTNGRYRGVKGKNGFDGLWISPEGNGIVIEVKTTTAFQIKLGTTESYRRQILDDESLPNNISILVVTADPHTEDLEAQIRGSRYAWDVRVISIDALQRLVAIKEKSDELETALKIRNLLVPFEYTRLDAIVDLVFTTALDVEKSEQNTLEEGADPSGEIQVTFVPESGFTPSSTVEAVRRNALSLVNSHLLSNLIRKTRATYADPVNNIAACFTVSKRYDIIDTYWFAYHPHWDQFLKSYGSAFLVLSFVDKDECVSIPHKFLNDCLSKLNTTTRPDGKSYWHIKIREEKDGDLSLVLPIAGATVSLQDFVIKRISR